jgi:hypothetical protein
MKLYGLRVGSLTIGIDLFSWNPEDLSGQEPVILSNIAVAGYSDITSIKNIYNFYLLINYDFLQARDLALEYLDSLAPYNVYTDGTDEEKLYATKFKIGTELERINFLGVEDEERNLNQYNQYAKDVRKNRVNRFFAIIETLLPNNLKNVAHDTLKVVQLYTEFGFISLLQNSYSGISDYIMATTGTEYELTGFRAQLWSPYGTDMLVLSYNLNQYMITGFYNP